MAFSPRPKGRRRQASFGNLNLCLSILGSLLRRALALEGQRSQAPSVLTTASTSDSPEFSPCSPTSREQGVGPTHVALFSSIIFGLRQSQRTSAVEHEMMKSQTTGCEARTARGYHGCHKLTTINRRGSTQAAERRDKWVGVATIRSRLVLRWRNFAKFSVIARTMEEDCPTSSWFAGVLLVNAQHEGQNLFEVVAVFTPVRCKFSFPAVIILMPEMHCPVVAVLQSWDLKQLPESLFHDTLHPDQPKV